MANKIQSPNVRLASLDHLRETIIAANFAPIPHRDTLREWLDNAGVRRFKANPEARRGGGAVYYVVSDVEKYIETRIRRCRQKSGTIPLAKNPSASRLAQDKAYFVGQHDGTFKTALKLPDVPRVRKN